MRSRPTLELSYSPRAPSAGDRVDFEATLLGHSDTPIDGVQFQLRGIEERNSHPVATGKSIMIARDRHVHLHQAVDFGPMTLTRGERRTLPFHLRLPDDLPPSFASTVSRIAWLLDVRVDIPWWPDRTATYSIPVAARPAPLAALAGSFSNAPDGPRGTELILELGLESRTVPWGGVVSGAVALANAQHHRVQRLEVALVVFDEPVADSSFGPSEVLRTAPLVVGPQPPRAGESYAFSLRLPTDVPPSFKSTLVQLVWRLEARAVVRLGSDLVMAPPINVFAPHAQPGPGRSLAPRVAPLGRERRALVWAEVARSQGLTSGGEDETMRGEFGPVSLALELELRGDQLFSVATLAWPDLGLDLHLHERRWRDALTGGATTGDEAFDRRFTVRGREHGQLLPFFTSALRARIAAFEQVTLDDEGAMLASTGNGYTFEELEPFVKNAVEAAIALSVSIEGLAPPAQLAPHRAAWSALAAEVGGRFNAGDFSVRDVTTHESRVELVTRFDAQGVAVASVARVLHGRQLPDAVPPEALPEEAQRVFTALSAECGGLRVTSDAVEATLPSPLPEPGRARSLWRALSRLAQVLPGSPLGATR